MSTDLEEILERLENLSPEEFRILEEKVKKGYKPNKQNANSTEINGSGEMKRIFIPGTHQPTIEEIEEELKSILTPEERVELDNFDPRTIKLPSGVKSNAELLSEDREDRF